MLTRMRTKRHKTTTFLQVFIYVLCLYAVPAAGAMSLKEYREKIDQSVAALDGLAQIDEGETIEAFDERRKRSVDAARSLLPGKIKVDWEGSSVTTDQSWLHDELDKYMIAERAKQVTVLRGITTKLQAISERLREAETSSAGGETKQEQNRKLVEILQRPEYAHRAKGKNPLADLVDRFIRWLQKFIPKPKPLAPGKVGFISQLAQVLVVLLALAVIGYALKVFLPRLWRNKQSAKKEKQTARIVLGEKLGPDQSSRDILAEAEALARRGDVRAAIRKAYIALLVELGERKVISLAQHKTNRDYLRAVGGLPRLYPNVKQLTDAFERHWYGLTQASDNDWQSFRSTYEQALRI